ncbi:hypothetical protein [Actinoplanes utahensis]|uniref:hypothetical protein n=1 Tax=Actinoplanes utahensis TaxID=1869 RepID=UPI00068BB415|nr:hypothetical protein [Actinoplanes utahensis]GIF35200.1 hypothetical protein Aut01nite_81860 [Actinoplanes utahensis]
MAGEQDDELWRQHPSLLRAAAWIPDADENLPRWDELEQTAVRWIEKQAAADGTTPVVFYNAAKSHGGPGPVSRLAGRYRFTYPLDRRQLHGAVLAFHPDARSLRQAADLARGTALVVLESAMTPLAGWAAATGAVDLSGVFPEPPPLAAEARKALDRALFSGGHNNWTGSHERDHARRALHDVMRSGLIDLDTAVGYVLGHAGVSELGAKNLRLSLEQVLR